ncbi:MAG: hypothetical protein AAFU73_19755 [Planctomycetota bacterium]
MSDSKNEKEERDFTRRALLRTGWAAPFVIAAATPILTRSARAQSTSDGSDPDVNTDGDVEAEPGPKLVVHHDGGHADLGNSGGGTYHADLNREHQDHAQHWDQDHFDQNHWDEMHVDGAWTHHFDHLHGDTQHSDYSQHADRVQTQHVDSIVPGRGSNHSDIP